MIDYYFILEIGPDATGDQVKKAYRRAALKHHPDRGGDHRRMQTVNAAYEVLRDPELRQQYDEVWSKVWGMAAEQNRRTLDPQERPESQPESPKEQPADRPATNQRYQEQGQYGPLFRQWQDHQQKARQARGKKGLSAHASRVLTVVLAVSLMLWLWLGYRALQEGPWEVIGFFLISHAYWPAALWVSMAAAAVWEVLVDWITRRTSTT